MDAWRTVTITAFRVRTAHIVEEGAVLDAALTFGPSEPRMVAAHRDTEQGTDRANGPDMAMLIHEPERHRVAARKMNAVFQDIMLRLGLLQLPFPPGILCRRVGRGRALRLRNGAPHRPLVHDLQTASSNGAAAPHERPASPQHPCPTARSSRHAPQPAA